MTLMGQERNASTPHSFALIVAPNDTLPIVLGCSVLIALIVVCFIVTECNCWRKHPLKTSLHKARDTQPTIINNEASRDSILFILGDPNTAWHQDVLLTDQYDPTMKSQLDTPGTAPWFLDQSSESSHGTTNDCFGVKSIDVPVDIYGSSWCSTFSFRCSHHGLSEDSGLYLDNTKPSLDTNSHHQHRNIHNLGHAPYTMLLHQLRADGWALSAASCGGHGVFHNLFIRTMVLRWYVFLALNAMVLGQETVMNGTVESSVINTPTTLEAEYHKVQAGSGPTEGLSTANIVSIAVGGCVFALIIALVAVKIRNQRRGGDKIEAGPFSSTYVGEGSLYILEDLSPCPILSLRPSASQDQETTASAYNKLFANNMYPTSAEMNASTYPQMLDEQHPSISESIESYIDSPFRYISDCESPRESDESIDNDDSDSSFDPNDAIY
ncbi:hypothetical protein THRCLA_01786 [Thraustotheca clavata]|uniref:Uncharacterized protein n=1 Tax=Thraustotheca clavata TaxID=74557 RepID=A0A1W0A775_9STRA|nr:hypothetical protein THRCLA_01786 [Thraustotheca clavata]